jgi:hypothetical protein
MTNFFTPANIVKSGWIVVGSDIVELDPSKRVLIGLGSTDVSTTTGLITKTIFGVVDAEVNSSAFFISPFGGVMQLVSTKSGTGSVLPISVIVEGYGEVVRFDTSGNTGYGVTVPLAKVHVATGADGWNLISERTAGATVGLYSDTVYGGVGTPNADPLKLLVNNTTYVYITVAGLVGVHQPTPVATVDIVGTLKASGVATLGGLVVSESTVSTITGTGINAITNFIHDGSGNTVSINVSTLAAEIGTITATDLSITANGIDAITIFNATGNVAINDSGTDFGYKLFVNGTVRANAGFQSDTVVVVGTTLNVVGSGRFGDNSAPDASAILDLHNTGATLLKGFLPPRVTTAQKNAIGSPAEGLIVYDTTLHKLAVRVAAAWETVTSV